MPEAEVRPLLLVTRPLGGAERFAAAAEAAGFDCLIDPMLTVGPVDFDPAELDGAQAVLITSAAAAPYLAATRTPRDTLALAVGDATAEAVKSAGFSNVESADGDVDALADLALRRLASDAGPVIHVAGARRAGDLSGRLKSAGFDARTSVVYAARPAQSFRPETTAALTAGRIGYAAFFSPQTGRAFVSVAADAKVEAALGRVQAVAISAAARNALTELNWLRLLTAAEPTAAALLAALVASAFGAAPEDGADLAT